VSARKGVVVLAVLALALVAGCGGGGGSSSELSQQVGAVKFRTFPVLRVQTDPGLDSLDPGLSYSFESWQSLWNVYLSPLGYRHANGPAGAEIVPALAEAIPSISGDKRVYKLRLREGLRYSNGQPVLASDFEYAIRRLYLLDSLGAPLFDDIVGANKANARRGDIPGIETDNGARTITIRLREPRTSMLNALASVFAAPIPASTPLRDQTRTPIPSTGPYRIVGVNWPRPLAQPKEFTLDRNPSFEPTATVPRTNPDRIVVSVVDDGAEGLRRVIAGREDYSGQPVAASELKNVQEKALAQLRTYTGANVYYFFLNTQAKPFDDVRVRRAVNYALDRRQFVRLFGGRGVPTENVVPPVYPWYAKHTLYPYDLKKAKELIRQAKAEGASVTVYGLTAPFAIQAVLYLQRQLKAIGLKPRPTPELLDPSVYWSTVGSRSTRAQIGYAYWIQSYPNPLEEFDPLFNGLHLGSLDNQNYSFANMPQVNQKIDLLAAEPELTPDVDARWAALDRQVMQLALIAPVVNHSYVDIFGRDVDMSCYVTHVLYQLDYGRLCLK
jgi:peptide/nickel transport system substrate-binding protein